MRRRSRKQPEAQLQKAVYRYIQMVAPNALCFHVPNGGKRNAIEASKLKQMGVMPGVADLFIFWKSQVNEHLFNGHWAAIELKAGKGDLTDPQKAFARKWMDLGGKWTCAKSIEDVSAALFNWGLIEHKITYCPASYAIGVHPAPTARKRGKS